MRRATGRSDGWQRWCRWYGGVLCAVALAISAAGAWAAEAPAASQTSKGEVWIAPPVQPWDETVAKGAPWAQTLNQRFSLARKGKAGEVHRYRFRRQNMSLERQGHVVQGTVFEGTLHRTLVDEKQPGVWREKLVWEKFGVGQALGGERTPVKDVPGAAGFTFDFFPPTFDYLNPPGDYTKLGDPMIGYGLKVVMMDVAGFDAMLMGLREDATRTVQLGETTKSPRWKEPMPIKAGEGAGVGGGYHLGAMTVSAAGLTRRNGEPCLLLWFAAEGNEVTQDTENPHMTMHMKATEYFRGTLAVSARDGHVVAGELWGPLPMVLVMGMGGQPATEQPIWGMMQQVSLWEIPVGAAQ